MENIISRRDFITRGQKRKASIGEKERKNDALFVKYANASMPFSNLRTTSGLETYTGAWTDAEIYHLLRRTTFGLSHASINLLKATNNASGAVDILLNIGLNPTTFPLNVYQNNYNDTQGCPFGEAWVNFAAPDNGDGYLNTLRTESSFKPWWFGKMINQNTDLLEKMTMFWANHFGARATPFNDSKAIWQHYQTIRANAFGNFYNMIKAITIDPHMLNVLNGDLNSPEAPDENYARELQELFTLGKGPNSGYTEDDVKQAAKILTGWRRTQNADGSFSSYFNDAEHDTSDKQFSAFYNNRIIYALPGANGQYETDNLLSMILATDEAAKYICRCLYRWFVYYVIDDAEEQNIISPLAAIFRNNNYEIAPVLKALFTSEHFFDPLNRGCIIKSPIDLYAGANREFSIPIPDAPVDLKYRYWEHFKNRCDDAGQKLADPVDISGWPAYRQEPVYYEAWINGSTILSRARSFKYYATTGFPLNDYNGSLVKIDAVQFNKQFSNPGDPNQVIADFIKFLLPADLSQQQKNIMKSILLNNLTSDYYWTNAWNAYIGTPTDPALELAVRQRLDALIDYITSMEEYQLY